jgi:predicted GIY-YIG superfamily endonuclease
MSLNGLYWVYLLYAEGVEVPAVGCSGSRDTYVGMAPDPYIRLQKHNSGQVNATRGRAWKLKALVPCKCRAEAAIVERWLKNGDTRQKRLRMATTFHKVIKAEDHVVREFISDALIWNDVRTVRKQYNHEQKDASNV